jgi:tetratricopeptide (TPR) repeat protein
VLVAIGLFGAFSKQTVVVLPLLFALYDWCFLARGRPEAMARRWRLYAVLVAIALVAGVWGFSQAKKEMAGFSVEGIEPLDYLASQAGVVLYYLRLVLFPDSLCFDCGYYNSPWPVLDSWIGDRVWIPAAVLVAVGAVAWRARPRQPLLAFCVWGCAILLAPTSSIMPFTSAYVEHRVYLSVALLAMLLSAALSDAARAAVGRGWLPEKPLRVALLLGAVAVWATLLALTVARNRVYQDVETLWSDTIAKAPESRRARYNLANLYLKRGEPERSLEHYHAAVDAGYGTKAYINLGIAYKRLDRYADAISVLEAGSRRQPRNGMLRRNIAMAYREWGKLPEAIDAMQGAIEVRPRLASYRKLLAELYAQDGRFAEALAAYRAAAAMNPRDREVERRIAELVERLGGS